MVCEMIFLLLCCAILWVASGQSSVHKSGVQRDVSFSSLAAAGCVLCYETSEESATKSKDIMSCSGPSLFIGTQKFDGSVLEVGAIAPAAIIQTEAARNRPRLSNGVYWHFERSCSFGFSATEHHQKSFRINDRKSADSTSYDVLWSIDQSTGCPLINKIGKLLLRAPSIMNSRNYVYNCPGPHHKWPLSSISSFRRHLTVTPQQYSRLITNLFIILTQH